ncbi:hypothetical protein [Listeria booriae]|uniref:hypothetical protein n=1 Tax=Listeria booriae TaxID=1552123 RepID=UPI0010EB2CD7|nr:hypothetical protein [Listeria booriae]EAD0711471.1 hypothetical protein [Listeria monocytogenes]EAD8886666.1 hypothetical protein [Listeria monocytogenes]MBC2162711.1 hypothetical protein [Listeria booriae]
MEFEFKTNRFSLLVKPDLSVNLQNVHGVTDRIELVIQTKSCSYSIDIQDTERLQRLLPMLQTEIQAILATYQLQLVTSNFGVQGSICYFDFTTREVSR